MEGGAWLVYRAWEGSVHSTITRVLVHDSKIHVRDKRGSFYHFGPIFVTYRPSSQKVCLCPSASPMTTLYERRAYPLIMRTDNLSIDFKHDSSEAMSGSLHVSLPLISPCHWLTIQY
jgi:hypothetical protein